MIKRNKSDVRFVAWRTKRKAGMFGFECRDESHITCNGRDSASPSGRHLTGKEHSVLSTSAMKCDIHEYGKSFAQCRLGSSGKT